VLGQRWFISLVETAVDVNSGKWPEIRACGLFSYTGLFPNLGVQ